MSSEEPSPLRTQNVGPDLYPETDWFFEGIPVRFFEQVNADKILADYENHKNVPSKQGLI